MRKMRIFEVIEKSKKLGCCKLMVECNMALALRNHTSAVRYGLTDSLLYEHFTMAYSICECQKRLNKGIGKES